MEPNKTTRKRVANFITDEKALLAQLISKTPIIESKLTDGNSVLKKKAAWASVIGDFNCHAHVYKLKNQEIRKRAAEFEEETNKTLLEKVKLELEDKKNN